MADAYCSSGKGDRNLTVTLERMLSAMNIRGRPVLVKPNMVDPATPKACSNPNRLKLVVDTLKKAGAGEVFLGDLPAQFVYDLAERDGTSFDLEAAYERLGYDKIGATLADLTQLPTTYYEAERLNPVTAQAERIEVPIYALPQNALLVNMTLPKHHGNFNFSGTTKNLMGLVPPDQRGASFHNGFERVALDFLGRTDLPRTQENIVATIYQLVDNFRKVQGNIADKFLRQQAEHAFLLHDSGQLDHTSLEYHLDHVMNAGALVGLRDHIRSAAPQSIHVLDGTYLLTRHEHDGTPKNTDFAIVGSDPAVVDSIALMKLGLDPHEIPYLRKMMPQRPSLEGDVGVSLSRQSLLSKELFQAPNGFYFSRVRL